MDRQHHHWEAIAEQWDQKKPYALWRQHSDAVNTALLRTWWPANPVGSILKTDLFDEAFGEGLYLHLRAKGGALTGVDVSASIADAARARYPELHAVVADVRNLPFADATFDLIVSNSTIDHFETAEEVNIALRELYRVLRPDGQLVLTLDNLRNPIIAARQALPFRLLNYLGLVPYFVGATFGPGRLSREVRHAGFQIDDMSAVMHCPRVVAVALAGLMERYAGHRAQTRFLRGLLAFEKLARLPTRFFTGHFVAIRAVK